MGLELIASVLEPSCRSLEIVDLRKRTGLTIDFCRPGIALSILRSSFHSGLDELVAENPGYHIAPNGKIYSDHCSVKQLRDLHHRIYREFYTPGQLFRIVRKGIRHGALGFLPRVLPRLPRLA